MVVPLVLSTFSSLLQYQINLVTGLLLGYVTMGTICYSVMVRTLPNIPPLFD